MRSQPSMDRREFLGWGAALGSAAVVGALAGEGRGGEAGEPTGKKIRVGVIGCGSVSRVYLPHLSACPAISRDTRRFRRFPGTPYSFQDRETRTLQIRAAVCA
jgi:hypothetical protein